MAIIIRTTVTYFMLILLMKLMGKRQLGELEVSELTVTFMLSDLASAPLLDLRMNLFDSFTPISVIVGLEILLAYVTLKSPLLKNALYGSPSVIIYKGKLDAKELRRQRLELGELLTSARQNNFGDFSDVWYCVLESDGKLSFFAKDDGDFSLPVIIDRRVISKNLKLLCLDRKWLTKRLSGKGLTERDVFLMTATENGDIYIIERKN